jgi:CubicO group peptidase (beta-lactamase class C family)
MSRTASMTLVGLTLAIASARAQTGSTALRDSLEARSMAFYTSSGTPGLAVGVWKDGEVIYARGFGVAAVGDQRPVTPRTVFHMASISKTFVATAIMQLVEQRKVQLDDPVTKYVPYFRLKDDRYRVITVRQLLSHTAGMPDVTNYAWDTPEYDDKALERWIRGLKDSTLIAAPGEKWEYSNIGFELLAELVATVSGESFEGYVKQHILRPAGMAHSTFLMTDVDSANLAFGHESSPTGQRRAYPYNRRHAGSSTMHSNVEDMLRYGAAHAGRGTSFLQRATYDLMWKAERDISTDFRGWLRRYNLKKMEMGLGWFLIEYDGGPIMNHDGGDRGFRSSLLVSPDRKTVVVVFVNSETNPVALSFPLLVAALR